MEDAYKSPTKKVLSLHKIVRVGVVGGGGGD